MDQIAVTALTPALLPAAAAIHAASFARPWDAEAMAALLALPPVAGALAAPVSHRADDWQAMILWQTVLDHCEILTIATQPAARRGKLAGSLLDWALARATLAGARQVGLEVAVDNAAAIALYRAYGFAECGRRHRYYATEEGRIDALLLQRRL